MKPLSYPRSLALTILLGSLGLSGCGGVVSFPDAVVSPQVQGPPMAASIYGGHFPIIGSHVYLLQPGTTGIGSAPTSLLGNNGATTANGYAITANPATGGDPNVPAGAKYVTADSSGNVSFTGGYTCTANQPVYIYASGGATPVTQPPTTGKGGTSSVTASISQVVVTNPAVDTNGGTATYAITLSSNEQLTANETVTIAGLTGNLAVLNGTQTVLAAPAPGATTFSVTAPDVYGTYKYALLGFIDTNTYYESVGAGAYTATTGQAGDDGGGDGGTGDPLEFVTSGTSSTGTGPFGTAGTATGEATGVSATTNPIVELATIGVCPDNVTSTTGNFYSGTAAISFIYSNEVSTVATAYTFQPFTVAANNNAWDIGSTGTTQALVGIDNAANTAAQLYAIQGNGQISATDDGEGHIANAATMAGNGVVPQSEIDSLANILAACIDSTPTGGLLSGSCTSLFNTATDNGSTVDSGDTAPTDTATAAINIARYPAGNHSGTPDATYAGDLFAIPTGTVPYAPYLAAAPNNWSIVISYTGGGITDTSGTSPHAIAVDATGNIYNANYSMSTFSKLSPLGVPANTDGFGTGLSHPSSVAIDSTSSNVWLANFGNATVSKCTVAGTCATGIALGRTGPQDAEIDGSGNVWVVTSTQNGVVEILGTTGRAQTPITTGIDAPSSLAIEPGAAGNIWVADTGDSEVSDCVTGGRNGTTCTAYTGGGLDKPVGIAIDNSGDIWLTNANGTVTAATNGMELLPNTPFTTGAASLDGVAIDGGGNVWVTSSPGFAVYELNNAGGVISPTTGYKSTTNTEPDGIAIDGSGNVWYDSATNNALYEVVGAATPVVTPISLGVTNGTLGQIP